MGSGAICLSFRRGYFFIFSNIKVTQSVNGHIAKGGNGLMVSSIVEHNGKTIYSIDKHYFQA